MNKFLLGESIDLSYNASSKARDDINIFAQRFGYSIVANNDKRGRKLKISKLFATLEALCQLFSRIKKNDILLVQSSMKVLPMVAKIKSIKKFRLIYLIHDLDAVRDKYDDNSAVQKEIDNLLIADYVIVHNHHMKEFLEKRGVDNRILCLDVFDYLIDLNRGCVDRVKLQSKYEIVFAGNLSPNKTGFIRLLDDREHRYQLNLYGNTTESFKHLNYCGKFKPDELPFVMQGDFGLVWEGDDLYVDESNHPYIMINNPHKVSLYIVSELPIIIWEKAALADFVVSNNIGITIKNLDELDLKVQSISKDDYLAMKNNTKKLKRSLINGDHLKKVLDTIELEERQNEIRV